MDNDNDQKLEQLRLCKLAVKHLLDAISYDPRKFWLMGAGTASWEKLTIAAAALFEVPVEKIRQDFRPDKEKYNTYCAELEANEKLLRHCREKGITAP